MAVGTTATDRPNIQYLGDCELLRRSDGISFAALLIDLLGKEAATGCAVHLGGAKVVPTGLLRAGPGILRDNLKDLENGARFSEV